MATTPEPKPVIFLTFANDRSVGGRPLRNLPDEARRLQELLEPLEHEGRFTLRVRHSVTIAEVRDLFLDRNHHNHVAVFHFGGHSDSLELILETREGYPATVNAKSLADFLGQQRGLRLVFLNACSNQAHVQGLLAAGVDAVIATTQDIYDNIAAEFASHFYQALAAGKTSRTPLAQQRQPLAWSMAMIPRNVRYVAPDDSSVKNVEMPWIIKYQDDDSDTAHWKLPDVPIPVRTHQDLLWVGVPDLPNRERIVGRQDLLDALVTRLLEGQSPALSTDGLPGVGKTTLAILVAHDDRIRNHFTDGVLWAGLGPAPDVPSVQAAWAEALGSGFG